MITEKYFNEIVNTLAQIKATQKDKILAAAKITSDVIKNDGIIYIFGCGHSHLIALDCFYRSGGLANVSAILDTDLMLHNGAAKSSKMEKMSGIAESILDRYCPQKNDLLYVVSTSGKNAVPVEMAKEAVKRGIKTISVVSSSYFEDKKEAPLLYEESDLFIDNCVPHGDAVININGIETAMGSISTAASSFILQSIILEASKIAADSGFKVPVYMSGNVEGGSEYNKKIIKEFLPKIKHL